MTRRRHRLISRGDLPLAVRRRASARVSGSSRNRTTAINLRRLLRRVRRGVTPRCTSDSPADAPLTAPGSKGVGIAGLDSWHRGVLAGGRPQTVIHTSSILLHFSFNFSWAVHGTVGVVAIS